MTASNSPTLAVTPHAFAAIVAQMTRQGYREVFPCAVIDGDEMEWTAFFATEIDPDGGINSAHECCAYTRCKLIGAWAENGDTGQLYAGNRDDIAATLGEKTVDAWERYAEEGANE
jgi:hypothetical protein